MTEQNEKAKACFCPNCNEPAKKIGNEIFCEKCDARFEIKKTGAARVKVTGEIEDLRNRVDVLEAAILPDDDSLDQAADQTADQVEARDQAAIRDQGDADQEEEILPG